MESEPLSTEKAPDQKENMTPGKNKMDYTKKGLETATREELISEFKDLNSLAFPGPIAKQNLTKVFIALSKRDGKDPLPMLKKTMGEGVENISWVKELL